MPRVLQEGFDLACVSVMDANGSLADALTNKAFGGDNNDDWPLVDAVDRTPLNMRGWKITTGLPTDPDDPSTYATNSGNNYTRAQTFLQLDNYYFHGSGDGSGSPLPINYTNDLTSNGLTTKFDDTGDIQSALKFLFDAPVWLEKKLQSPWGTNVSLVAQGNNDDSWNCLYLNFCLRVADMAGQATGVISLGLGADFGFLVIPLGGGEIKFFKNGAWVETGVSILQEGFGVFHQFVVKYLVDPNTSAMKIEIWVNGIQRYDLAPFDASGILPLNAEKLTIGKFGNGTVHLDDVIVDAETEADLSGENYSTKDKFIISLPSRPKATISSWEQNKVFIDYHDISIMKGIGDAFAASSEYVNGTFEVKDKTAVMIVKGNGSLNQLRQAHGDWDPNDALSPTDVEGVDVNGATQASNAWMTAPVVDISVGYESFVKLQSGVNHTAFMNRAEELVTNGSTNDDDTNRDNSMPVSYSLMGDGTHNIDLTLVKNVTAPDWNENFDSTEDPANMASTWGMPMANQP